MWNAATYATTGIAIAGIGATCYALSGSNNVQENANDALSKLRALAGFSNTDRDHSLERDPGISLDNYSTYYAHPCPGSFQGQGRGRLFTASQSFLKAELEALANADRLTPGLNALGDDALDPQAPTATAKRNSSMDISRTRVVRRVETDPAIYPPGGIRSNNSLDCSNELGMGSQSENFGYIWRKDPPPDPLVSEILQSRSSHSAFDVETCSEIFNYSSDEGASTSVRAHAHAPKTLPEPDARNLPTMTSSAYAMALHRLEEMRQKRKKTKPTYAPTSSRSADFARRRTALAPGKRPRIPRPSNPHLCLKSAPNTTKGMLLNTNTRPNPYLTRAEPILCFVANSRVQFKDPKSSSTTEKLQREAKGKRKSTLAVRRCEASAPATSVFSSSRFPLRLKPEPEPEVLVDDNANAQMQDENVDMAMERDSIEFLYPVPRGEPSSQSIFISSGVENLEDDEEGDQDEVYEEAFENYVFTVMNAHAHAYNEYLEEEMAHAEVSEDSLGNNADSVMAGPVGSSCIIESVSRSCQTTPTPSEIALRLKEGPYVLATFGGIRVVLRDTGTSAELERRNSGIVYGIPRDSWIMLPLRLLPTSMLPWGLVFYIPFIFIFVGMFVYAFGAVFGSSPDLDLDPHTS